MLSECSQKAMIPDSEKPENLIPHGAKDLGRGYVLISKLYEG